MSELMNEATWITSAEHRRIIDACERGDALTPEEVELLARRLADDSVAWSKQSGEMGRALIATVAALRTQLADAERRNADLQRCVEESAARVFRGVGASADGGRPDGEVTP